MDINVKSGVDRDPFQQTDRGGFGHNAGKGDFNRSMSNRYAAGYEETNLGKVKNKPGKTTYRYK